MIHKKQSENIQPIAFIFVKVGKEGQKMRGYKKVENKYVMLVTSEDERYRRGEVGLDFFINRPWEGILEEIIFGNSAEELYGNGGNEGLFYQVYDTETGKRIGYGTIDPNYPREDIEEWEKEKIKEGEGSMENQERITLSFTDDIGYTEFKVLKSWYNIRKDNMTVEKMYFVASGDEESGFIS